MPTSAKPIEEVYVFTNERQGVERSFELLIDLDFDPVRTHWEQDGRVWIVFSDMKDAIHFRLRFAGWAELIDSCEAGVAAVLIVSLDFGTRSLTGLSRLRWKVT